MKAHQINIRDSTFWGLQVGSKLLLLILFNITTHRQICTSEGSFHFSKGGREDNHLPLVEMVMFFPLSQEGRSSTLMKSFEPSKKKEGEKKNLCMVGGIWVKNSKILSNIRPHSKWTIVRNQGKNWEEETRPLPDLQVK